MQTSTKNRIIQRIAVLLNPPINKLIEKYPQYIGRNKISFTQLNRFVQKILNRSDSPFILQPSNFYYYFIFNGVFVRKSALLIFIEEDDLVRRILHLT